MKKLVGVVVGKERTVGALEIDLGLVVSLEKYSSAFYAGLFWLLFWSFVSVLVVHFLVLGIALGCGVQLRTTDLGLLALLGIFLLG